MAPSGRGVALMSGGAQQRRLSAAVGPPAGERPALLLGAALELQYLFSDGENNRCRDLENESCASSESTVVLEQSKATEKTMDVRISIFDGFS